MRRHIEEPDVKGKSMLVLSRDLGVDYKTAFVSLHKGALGDAGADEAEGLALAAKHGR